MRLLKSLVYQLIDSFEIFQKQGLWAGLIKLSQIGFRIFYSRDEGIVLAKVVSGSEFIIEPLPDLVVQQIKTREELALLRPLAGATNSARFYRMFETGAVVFSACYQGQIVGWGWLTDRVDLQTNRVQAPLRPGDACLYDLFVAPTHRGRGIAQRLVAARLQFLHKQGYKRSIITCTKNDLPALKVAERANYQNIGQSSHTRFLFWDHFEYKPSKIEEQYNV